MAGTMRERSPGVWQLRAYLGRDPLTGNPVQKARTFRGTESAAKKALARLVTEADDNKFNRTTATVGQLLDRWLKNAKLKPSTRRDYDSAIEHVIRPALGDVRVARLRADALDGWYQQWLTEIVTPANKKTGRSAVRRSASTVRKYHSIIHTALRQAVKWDWIDKNPADNASPPRVKAPAMNAPTPDDIQLLVADARDHDPVLATAIMLAALTGARRGELVALRWSDVKPGRLVISRSIAVVKGTRHEGDTKTHQVRVIGLDPLAEGVLEVRRQEMEDLSAEADSPLVADPYVLSYRADGAEPVNPDTLTGGFRRCAKRVGLPHHFHELRHFMITTGLAAGVDLRTMAGRAGHADASVTARIYAHVLEAQDQTAAAILGRALSPTTKGELK